MGVIAYFLLAGYTPFDRDSQQAEMEAIIAGVSLLLVSIRYSIITCLHDYSPCARIQIIFPIHFVSIDYYTSPDILVLSRTTNLSLTSTGQMYRKPRATLCVNVLQ